MNDKEFRKILEEADKKDWHVCYQIAEYYYEQKEYLSAFSWYKKASELSDCNPIVYFEIGYLYQHGEGVDSDLAEAIKWYEKAAEEEVPQAFYNLAYFYQNGLVVDKNPEKALYLLKRATSSMRNLQVERYLYETWKEKSEKQLTKLQEENTIWETKVKNIQKEIEIEKEMRIKAEQLASQSYLQMENSSRAAEELIKKIVEDNNENYKNIQSSFELKIDELQKNYKEKILNLQKMNEELHEQNIVLDQTVKAKTKEIMVIEEKVQLLQTQLFSEIKKVKNIGTVIILLGIIIMFLTLIF